jgi:hypothetical protein
MLTKVRRKLGGRKVEKVVEARKPLGQQAPEPKGWQTDTGRAELSDMPVKPHPPGPEPELGRRATEEVQEGRSERAGMFRRTEHPEPR